MGEIVVTVNGRAFPLNCADGEETRIRRLAQYVDGKIVVIHQMEGEEVKADPTMTVAMTTSSSGDQSTP